MLRRKPFLAVLFALFLASSAACGDEDSGAGADTDQGKAQADCNTQEVETEQGLVYRDVECGTGMEAEPGDTIFVHYTGKLQDGTQFDSSRGGDPLPFVLGAGQVIQGWDLGYEGMKVGGKRVLTIPPELGYGAAGAPPDIPPNATLIFQVELVDVEPAEG